MSQIGSTQDLTKYLNMNLHIFERDRPAKQYMQRIMAMLSHDNMRILQREFEQYPNGLQLPTFIYLMKRLYTPQNEMAKYFFVSDLIKFFQAIDVNGDGHLEWSQFTEYIIESIRKVDRPRYQNKAFQENEIISSAYSKISNEYKITNIIDAGTSNYIRKIVYLNKEQKYYLLQVAGKCVRIYDGKFELKDWIEVSGESEHTSIVDFSFDKRNHVFCALNDGSAKFCNMKVQSNFKLLNECDSRKLKNYHKVQHLPGHQLWAFLAKTGELKLSTAEYTSRTMIEFQIVVTVRQHEGLITDICEVENPMYVVTSSMDGNIKYYSVQLKRSLEMEHTADQTASAINAKFKKGVLGIDHGKQFGSYMLSYGFSSAISIYSLEMSLLKGFTGKYTEHSGNLFTAKFLKSFPYVISFDDKLSLRIWDFRSFQTMQILNCQKNFINPSRLQIIPELSECLICQKKITQLRAPFLQNKSKQLNQFHNVFDFKICSLTNNIFLFTSNDVRVYNYVTGCLEHVFANLSQHNYQTNITACQFGHKCRKFFVGDAGGFVRQYCSETGDYLQEIKPRQEQNIQNKAIVKIIFLKQHSLLIVCSEDGRIMIYIRNSDSQFEMVRDIRQSHFELTCAAASLRYCILATGSDQGHVNLWNLQRLSFQTMFLLSHKILNIMFSPIHPIMLIGQQTGQLSLFYIKPYEDLSMRNHCLVKLKTNCYITSIGMDLILTSYIKYGSKLLKQGKQYTHNLLLSIGDKDGRIRLINLNQVIERYGVRENHQIGAIGTSMKCQVHCMKAIIAQEKKRVLMSMGVSNGGVECVDLDQLKQVVSIDAHKEGVDKLLVVKENSVLLSISAEKKMKLWNFQGELNGAIDFFTFKKVNWKIPQLNFHRKLQAIDTVIYSLKLIQNKQLQPSEQQFIRVHLLMNEYMTAKDKQTYLQQISILLRNKQRGKSDKRIRIMKKPVQKYDVREQLDKRKMVRNSCRKEEKEGNVDAVEFNYIYNKLVGKIKERLNSSPKEQTVEEDGQGITDVDENKQKCNENLQVIKTVVLQQKYRKGQKQMSKMSNIRNGPKKKLYSMLYTTLVQACKNVQSNEKKCLGRMKRIRI